MTITTRLAIVALATGTMFAGGAAFVTGCGDSTTDLPEKKVRQIEPEGIRAYHSPNQFPNVVTYCIVGGHRVVLNTREQGNPVVVIPKDESCSGAR